MAKEIKISKKVKKNSSRKKWFRSPFSGKKKKKLETKSTNKSRSSKSDKNSSRTLGISERLEAGLEKTKTKRKNSKRRKWLKRIFLISLFVFSFFGVLAYFFIIAPVLRIKASVDRIEEIGLNTVGDLEDKDISNLDSNIDEISLEIEKINTELNSLAFLKEFDQTKGYYENLQIAKNVADKSNDLIIKTVPKLKNVLRSSGFKIDNTSIPKKTSEDEGALTLVMSELPLYLALYEDIEPDLYEIFEEINSINKDYLPSAPGVNVKGRLEKFEQFTKEYPEKSEQVVSFLEYVPELVGSDDPTKYLIILQNETEMRASGGLLTAYGTMTVDNGEFGDDLFLSDMWNLEIYVSYELGIDVGYRNTYGQLTLMLNGCGATYLRAQDSGIYPDLNWTMNTISDYYDYANQYDPEDFPDYENILILNNTFATNLLNLVAPLEVEGYGEVNAENFFDLIKEETDNPDLIFNPERKAIIGKIANAAKDKFAELPLEDFPKILDLVVDSFYARDLAIASPNEDVQNYLDKYGMSGKTINEFDGDFFHLNEAQNCSLKLNKWVRNEVVHDIYINDDGSIDKNIKVNWQQPKVYESALDAQYSQSLQFSYRAWVRLFTPPGVLDQNIYTNEFSSNGLNSSGYLGYYPREYYDEIENVAISDNIIRFDHRRFKDSDPIPTQNLEVSYKLPEDLNYNVKNKYQLYLQKHPGKSWGEKNIINIHQNGKTTTKEIVLDQDKILNYRMDSSGAGIISVANSNTKLDWLLNLANSIPFDNLDTDE